VILRSSRGARAALLAAAVTAGCLLAGCGLLPGARAGSTAATSRAAAASAPAAPTPRPQAATAAAPVCPAAPHGFSCTMRARIAAVEQFLRGRPGMIGIVLRDRVTGAVWQNKYAATPVYMASTSKLAMAVTLLQDNAAGVIHLSSADWATLHDMLHVSSDNAADDLWFKYGSSLYTSYFPRIGLASAQYLPQAGVSGPYWGEMMCPAADLSALVNYVLTDLPPAQRSYLVTTLRGVAADQHFGVWGAGPAEEPGNKDGWSVEKPGWIINSAGFAGPGERYTLAMMNSLNGEGGYQDGTDTVTQVAAILFQGHQIPAPTLQATP
jgi:hypothetical protein